MRDEIDRIVHKWMGTNHSGTSLVNKIMEVMENIKADSLCRICKEPILSEGKKICSALHYIPIPKSEGWVKADSIEICPECKELDDFGYTDCRTCKGKGWVSI